MCPSGKAGGQGHPQQATSLSAIGDAAHQNHNKMRASVAMALLLALLLSVAGAQGSVVMVFSIQRHGARNSLPKTLLLKESESLGGPTLLPVGQRMCYDAGVKFRERYIDTATCSDTCLLSSNPDTSYGVINQGKGYNNYNTLVRSSYTDRAILSAQAFFGGIFPANASNVLVTNTTLLPTGQQLIPVYTMLDENDWLIRAYTKCDKYQAQLLNWYASSEFQSKATETTALRATVKQLVPALDTSLTNWWNVYDSLNTWRTYGVGDPQPSVDDVTWNATRDLAAWLETAKMKSDLTQNLLGGPLVADMMRYMDAATSAVQRSQQVYYKFLSISSHYNVQLGVLAALQLDKYPPAVVALNWLNATLPQLASVVVFELHAPTPATTAATTAQPAVRLVVQQGPGKAYVVVPLPCEVAGDAAEVLAGKGACTLDSFRQLASPAALDTAAAWCGACGNTDAMPCALANARTQLVSSSSPSSSDVSQSQFNLAVALAVVLTFLGTLGLSAVLFGVMYNRLKKRSQPAPGEGQGEEAGQVALKLSGPGSSSGGGGQAPGRSTSLGQSLMA